MGYPVCLRYSMQGRGCHSARGAGFKKKNRNLPKKTPVKAQKKTCVDRPFSFDLLVDTGSHETDDDHDTKKTSNNGENGAVKTSHVILLAFGTLFQK